MEKQKYSLPKLNYGYNELAPYISEQQLTLHHQKHHQAYVNGANAVLDKLGKARSEAAEIDIKATLKELSFHIGGHVLHSLFWENMAPAGKGGEKPSGMLEEAIISEFGSFERFKKEFSQAAVSVEGSGWAALAYCKQTKRLLIAQIEKHNVNLYPNLNLLMVIDVWEHAYYLDYKNERAKFVEAFWKIVNWDEVAKRFGEAAKY
ncbi:MAG: superoxide dismutase [Candidatus Micrarchaeia archaeon]